MAFKNKQKNNSVKRYNLKSKITQFKRNNDNIKQLKKLQIKNKKNLIYLKNQSLNKILELKNKLNLYLKDLNLNSNEIKSNNSSIKKRIKENQNKLDLIKEIISQSNESVKKINNKNKLNFKDLELIKKRDLLNKENLIKVENRHKENIILDSKITQLNSLKVKTKNQINSNKKHNLKNKIIIKSDSSKVKKDLKLINELKNNIKFQNKKLNDIEKTLTKK